jgi:RND family efflux transporter MFP subunit
MPADHTPRPVLSRRGLRLSGIVLALLAAVIVIGGILSREQSSARLRDWTEAQAVPTVTVMRPGTGATGTMLDLPGRVEAYSRAPLYARVSGYLKAWHADIGAPVKAGQLLAEIEAPDLDQQLAQAQADLATAEANAALSGATLKRRQELANSNYVSRQDLDEKNADRAAKLAVVRAQQANVSRLQAMSGFKRIVAPFDGIVTARDTDIGVLINAGGGAALFVVSDVRKLRVYVDVPQKFVPDIKTGATARIAVPERAGKTFSAVVEGSAQAVEIASGTTRMQLGVDNTAGELLPGSFASVRFELPQNATILQVPGSALVFDRNGVRIAVADADDRVAFRQVTIARDLGKVIEISSGLQPDDRVIDSPPDGIAPGDKVRVLANTEAANPPR